MSNDYMKYDGRIEEPPYPTESDEVARPVDGLVMRWRETTNQKDPLSRDGEYTCDQPWLEHSCNGGIACYTVRFNRFQNKWEPRWWHGNHGYGVKGWAAYDTLAEAKLACANHLQRMREALGA